FAESGYVAGQTLVGALKHVSGSITAASVEASLESGAQFSTLAGPVTFSSSNHLGVTKLLITKVTGGKVTLTGSSEQANCRSAGAPMGMTTLFIAAGLAQGAMYALMAASICMVYRPTRLVNFAHGAFAFIALLTFISFCHAGIPIGAALAL